jgi:hypothetical protein
MIDRFEELLQELGHLINLPLHVDRNRLCCLSFNQQLHLQLKMDESLQRLLVSAIISEVPLGPYREELFKEALKNNHSFPRPCILAFTAKTNQLVGFDYLSLINLNGEKLVEFLTQFITFIDPWRIAIENGTPVPTVSPSSKAAELPPFGIRL